MAHDTRGPTWPPCFISGGWGEPKNRDVDECYCCAKARAVRF